MQCEAPKETPADPWLLEQLPLDELLQIAQAKRDTTYGATISYSRKAFLPLTKLCRNVCHYCTFAKTPGKVDSYFMSLDEIHQVIKTAEEQGCKEALITLGEKPELRYKGARQALQTMGFDTTIEYVCHVADYINQHSTLIPHVNAGCLTRDEISALKQVSPSIGLMLETSSHRLGEKGMPHYGSPDKNPAERLATLRMAGEAQVPTTTGILIGIGETRRERIESLLEINALHQAFGHIQEVIVQNFRAKPDTKMKQAPEPDLDDICWTIAVARILLDKDITVQAPPNLNQGATAALISAGINDFGGISPVTPDFINPECPWPNLERLAEEVAFKGKVLVERLSVFPSFILQKKHWITAENQARLNDFTDAEGYAKEGTWSAGVSMEIPADYRPTAAKSHASSELESILEKAFSDKPLHIHEVIQLFQARGNDYHRVCEAANQMRVRDAGNTVTYVVNRNINYSNICYFKCGFCSFSKGKVKENLREKPYDMGYAEIVNRAKEAWDSGASEVCLQGGIHPNYDGNHYLTICREIKAVLPDIHIHAFSPLEVFQGAATLGITVTSFLKQLKAAGLGTLPGTAAEVLDDRVRDIICPDKLNSRQWLDLVETAHQLGIRTTSTIMFGHVDNYESWAIHLLRLRDLQQRTGGLTEFVPLPYVGNETPIYKKGQARKGPGFREAVLMHAVSRLVFGSLLTNIQASWVKMGEEGVKACLNAGANDLGGTLMNESITRAAGAKHGTHCTADRLQGWISSAGRTPCQRTTSYRLLTHSVDPTDRKIGIMPPYPGINVVSL